MKIAVFGGSFNPPHVGHAMVAAWIRWTGCADQVWLVPVFQHAFGKDLTPFDERLAWCDALAKSVGPWVKVSTVEEGLPVPSYSIDTLSALQRQHPEHAFRLVVGSDILDETHKWKQWEDIERHFAPIIVGRQGYAAVEGTLSFPTVSSTEVRGRLARGETVDHLLLAEVARLVVASRVFG